MSDRPRPRLKHRAEEALVAALEGAVAHLPPSRAARLGAHLGALVRSPLAIRRSVVEENLRRAFPDADTDWIDDVARASFRHLGREVAAMLRLYRLDVAQVRSFVEIPDPIWARLVEAREEGRGLLLVTGHYGNWEMAAAAIAARGVPIKAIVKQQSNPLVDARIAAARRRLGVGTITMDDAPRRVPRALLSNRAVGIVADQDARGAGIHVPFFGTPASTPRGPALFALRLNAPLFAAVARTLPDGRYRISAERIDTRRTASLDEDVYRVTAALAAHLEREVRLDPTQYFWFHKRWKTPPP